MREIQPLPIPAHGAHAVSRREVLTWLGALSAAAVVTPLLAACGGDDDDDDNEQPTTGAATPTAATGAATATAAAGGATPTTATGAATVTTSGEPMAAEQVLLLPNSEPPRLDPHLISSYAEIYVTTALFDALIEITREGEVAPLTADTWDVSEDGVTYTFTIRPDAAWSDGTPITAEDFEWSYKRMLAPETACPVALFAYNIQGAFEYNNAETTDPETVAVNAVDERTLQVELTGPAPFFIKLIALYSFPPVPRAAVEQHGDQWVEPPNMLTNGPFKLEKWEHDVEHVMVRNENYPLESAKLERITWRVLTDTLAPYENDELDVTGTISFADAERVQEDATLAQELVPYPFSGIQFIAFDSSNTESPIGKPEVRQALYLAIDRDVIANEVLRGLVEPAPVMLPPGIVGRNLDAVPQGGVEAAKTLLADAGYPEGEGFEITLTWSQSPSTDLLGQIVQQMWQDNLGIKVNLTPTEAQAFRAWRNSLSDLSLHYDCYLIGNGTDFEDPYNYHVQLFQSDQGDYYKFRWVNAEYDALAKAESVELDPAKREEIALQADAILAQDMPAIPIHYLHNSRLVKPHVRDLQWLHVSTDRFLHKVWIAEG